MDINSDHQNNTLKENTNLFLPQDQKILHNYNSNKDILNELMQNQRKNLIKNKLLYTDIKRLQQYLSESIFSDQCSLWTGHVSNIKNNYYVYFYLNKKKHTLQRLLYNNYIGDIKDSEYIKFTCSNKGICCSIKHLIKYV
jgi:hypothetical protein